MLTTSDPNVVLGNDMTTITITDNDSECVCVSMYYWVSPHMCTSGVM
jgi:hypothetical protein